MLSDVDSFNYNFFSVKVSFISYINLWAKFQNNRQLFKSFRKQHFSRQCILDPCLKLPEKSTVGDKKISQGTPDTMINHMLKGFV